LSLSAEEIRATIQQVLREELPRMLAELRQPAPVDGLLGVEAAAKRLGLSTSTVYKRGQRGHLPCIKDGSRVLFRPADLDAYAEARRRSPDRVRALARGA